MYLHCADEEVYLKKLNILYKGTQKVAGQKKSIPGTSDCNAYILTTLSVDKQCIVLFRLLYLGIVLRFGMVMFES